MRCIEQQAAARRLSTLILSLASAVTLGACFAPMPPIKPLPSSPPSGPPTSIPQAGSNAPPTAPEAVAAPARPVPPPASMAALSAPARMAAPRAVRTWNEVRLQAAKRLVDAHPESTYMGAAPDVLLAIPVLEIELNADGSVRRVNVLRVPTQATDTVQLAIAAVKRAAPYGDVSRLPKPWHFTETFLFNDDRKFKPRTLD